MKELLNTGVHIDLDYSESENALIGKIKGYSAAVRENLNTGSYGVLLWVKKGEYAAIKTAEDYLDEQMRLNPNVIKNFRVTELGTAVALNRTDDPFANINNLKRFLINFADFLSVNFYVNCCCKCGSADNLGIYDADGVITQVCGACAESYRPIIPAPRSVSAPAGQNEMTPEQRLTVAEPIPILPDSEPDLTVAVPIPILPEEEASAPETDLDDFSGLFDAPAQSEAELPKNEEDDGFSDLLFSEQEEEEKPEPIKSAVLEQQQEEFLREQALNSTEETDDSDDFDDLLYDSMMDDLDENPEDIIREEKKPEVPELGFSELLINDGGEMELKKKEQEIDDGTVVTEIHDDSNDGDPIDVSEIKSLVLDPTVTTGHPQLTAEETPLERDGSVPLVNPTANLEETHVSPADGPDAVTPLETQQNAYNREYGQRTDAFDKGFATAENMIDRDAPVDYSRDRKTAPPPYKLENEYLPSAHSAPPPYSPESNYSSYVHSSISSKSNPVMGIIGALTCGVVGVLIWVMFAHFFNVISRFGAIAIVFTAFGGYYLAGRELDKKGIVISLLLSFLMTFAGVVSMSALSVCSGIKEVFGADISFFESLRWIEYFIRTDAQVKSEFMSNLGFSFISTGISAVVATIYFWKRAS